MKIVALNPKPILTIPSVNVAPGGRRVEKRHIPLLHGRVDILPKGINGLLITSDLQGFEEGALQVTDLAPIDDIGLQVEIERP